MNFTLGVFLLILALVIVAVIIGGRKKRWYKIYMANGDTMLVYRTTNDYWYRDSSGLVGFHLPNGRKVKVSRHFLIKIEEEDGESGK